MCTEFLYRQHTFDCETEALLPASEDGEYEDTLALGFKTHGEMEKCKAMGFKAVEKSAYDEYLRGGFKAKMIMMILSLAVLAALVCLVPPGDGF